MSLSARLLTRPLRLRPSRPLTTLSPAQKLRQPKRRASIRTLTTTHARWAAPTETEATSEAPPPTPQPTTTPARQPIRSPARSAPRPAAAAARPKPTTSRSPPRAPPSTPPDAEPAAVNWTSSYHGVSAAPFPPEVGAILHKPLDPADVEIKPDGIVFLPEIKYRNILFEAFGPGGWGMVPRGEPEILQKMVTREWALVVNGR